jgi:hypothetical protein
MYYTVGKVFSRPFQRYIKSLQIPKIKLINQKIIMYIRLMSADQGGQKNRIDKQLRFFLPCFLLVT